MDLLEAFEVERLDTCGLEGFELDWEEKDVHQQRGKGTGPAQASNLVSPSIVNGKYTAIRQLRQMAEHRKSRVLFISPLEEEEDLKSVKLTPRENLARSRSALSPSVLEETGELETMSASESGSEKNPPSLTRRNSESQVEKTGGWFTRSWSAGKSSQ